MGYSEVIQQLRVYVEVRNLFALRQTVHPIL